MTEMLHKAEVSTYLPTYTVPAYQQAFGEDVKYYDNFELNTSGWSVVQAVTNIPRTNPGHAGNWAMTGNRNTGVITTSSVINKTFTGLTVGRSHTVTAWHRANDGVVGDVYTTLRVAGVGDDGGQYHTGGDLDWYKHTFTFTTTSSSITVRLEWASAYTGADVLWDEVTVTRDAYAIDVPAQTIYPDGTPTVATPTDLTVQMDESWAPFVQATVRVANQDLSAMEAIDPHSNPRMTIGLTATRRESKTMGDFNAYMIAKYGASPTMADFNTEYISYSMAEFNNGRPGVPTPPAWSRSYSLGEIPYESDFNATPGAVPGWTPQGVGTYSVSNVIAPGTGQYKMALTGSGTQVAAYRYIDGFEPGATYYLWVYLSSLQAAPTTRHSQIYLQTPSGGPIWGVATDVAPSLATSPIESQVRMQFVAQGTRAGLMVQMYTTGVVGTTYVSGVKVQRISSPADPDPITMDLGIRSRNIDYKTGDVTFTLASDEALLQDTPLISTVPLTPPVNTVYDCVNLALRSIGASAPSGTPTTPPQVQAQTSWESGSTDGWVGATTTTSTYPIVTSVLSNTTAQARTGTHALAASYNNNNGVIAYVAQVPTSNMQIGRAYTASVWVLWNGAATRGFYLNYLDGGTGTNGTYVNAPNGVWTQVVVNIPAITSATGTLSLMSGALTSGFETVVVDDYTLTANSFPINPSSLTVAADAASWKPGDTAWDYITPILTANNLRLWCDNNRLWHLEVPQTYSIGSTTVSDILNIEDLSYQIDRDDDTWFDAAIVIYNWTDTGGIQHTAYDTYASPGWTKGKTIKYDTAYPGPGAARELVNRAIGRGLAAPIAAVSDYGAYPGDALTLKQTNKTDKTGYIESVTWTFPDHTMRIEPRGLSN